MSSVPPNCSAISPASEDFTFLQFRLRLATRSTGLTLKRAFAVGPLPHNRKSNKVLEGWVEASRLEGGTSLATICSKGFTVSARGGLGVHVGNLSHLIGGIGEEGDWGGSVVGENNPRPSTAGAKSNGPVYRFLLCEFHMQKAFLIDGSSSGHAVGGGAKGYTIDDLPPGYDAIYIRKAEPQAGGVISPTPSGLFSPRLSSIQVPQSHLNNQSQFVEANNSPSDYYRHEFVTFSSNNIVPRFILEFEVDASQESAQLNDHVARKICEGCRAVPATIWCELEKVQLCKTCDREVHSHPLTDRHRRVPLSEEHTRLHLRAFCSAHNDRLAEFYCEPCKKVLCVDCKVSGSHAAGICASHTLLPLRDLYADVLAKTADTDARDPDAENYRRTIARQAQNLANEIAKVEARGRAAEEEIRASAERAIASVRGLVSRKVRILRSDSAELQRMLDQLDWGFSYIQYASQLLAPVEFLQMWKCYGAHHRGVVGQTVEGGVPVQPDILVEGELRVYSPSMEEVRSKAGVPVIASSPAAGARRPPVLLTGGGVGAGGVADPSPVASAAPTSPRRAGGQSPRVFANKLKELGSPGIGALGGPGLGMGGQGMLGGPTFPETANAISPLTVPTSGMARCLDWGKAKGLKGPHFA